MEKIWFVYTANDVSGPFSTEQIKQDYQEGRWNAKAQIWWKGQREWISLARWLENLEQILSAQKQIRPLATWYTEILGNQTGPLTKAELIQHLKDFKDLKNVRLWTVGKDHWANIFEFHEILNHLGISKREHNRAPITGLVNFSKNGQVVQKMLASVSEGGFGMKYSHDLVPGEILNISLQSQALATPVKATAKVMYVEPSGFAGLKFESIHIEAKSSLIDYVKHSN